MLPSISCTELMMQLGEDDVLVVDLRDGWASGGRIPGSLPMTIADLVREYRVLPDDELIVLCGAEPDGSDAELAWWMLHKTHPRTLCLEGGFAAWKHGGYPLDPAPGDLQPETVY